MFPAGGLWVPLLTCQSPKLDCVPLLSVGLSAVEHPDDSARAIAAAIGATALAPPLLIHRASGCAKLYLTPVPPRPWQLAIGPPGGARGPAPLAGPGVQPDEVGVGADRAEDDRPGGFLAVRDERRDEAGGHAEGDRMRDVLFQRGRSPVVGAERLRGPRAGIEGAVGLHGLVDRGEEQQRRDRAVPGCPGLEPGRHISP